MLDRIVIAGAGRTIESILERLVHLAPVVVMDTSQAALDELRNVGGGESTLAHGVTKRLADATSRFVLEEMRSEQHHSVALVAATGDDRRNLEICRLAKELGFHPLVGVVIRPETAAEYEVHGARAIVRAHILGNVVEQALRYDGLIVASMVGQGRGEIIEFSVLPSSPAIGSTLSHLHAEGWRIAAIYRGSEMVIPTGDTVIATEDRILLIGNPEILPAVAEQLRIGVPQFPLNFGNPVVVCLPNGRSAKVEEEAEYLVQRTRASGMILTFPGAEREKKMVEVLLPAPSTTSPRHHRKLFERIPMEPGEANPLISQLRAHRPGLVFLEPLERSFFDRIFGRGGFAARLGNELNCPLLFTKGNGPYQRIVIALARGSRDLRLADLAIDLVRLLSLPLFLFRVSLPQYIEAPDSETEQLAQEIERRARLYGVKTTTSTVEGNPVREILHAVTETDLLLVGRKNRSRDSFTTPDIALRVARAANCSILVLTEERR